MKDLTPKLHTKLHKPYTLPITKPPTGGK